MHFSRVMFGGASLMVLFLLFSLGISCGDEKPKKGFVSLSCTNTVDVDPTAPAGVKPADIYVCSGSKVTWKANGHKFTVIFKHKQCPFTGGCKDINQDSPTSSTPVKDLKELTVYDYEILVDGELFDPHVVGGGG